MVPLARPTCVLSVNVWLLAYCLQKEVVTELAKVDEKHFQIFMMLCMLMSAIFVLMSTESLDDFVSYCSQKEEESPELAKGAVEAVQDLYDVVRHDIISFNMRYGRDMLIFVFANILFSFYTFNIACIFVSFF